MHKVTRLIKCASAGRETVGKKCGFTGEKMTVKNRGDSPSSYWTLYLAKYFIQS